MIGRNGKPVMLWNDSSYYQGQTLQDLWFQHLREDMELAWVERGKKKTSRDPDRLEPEEYKLQQEREKLEFKKQILQTKVTEQNQAFAKTKRVAQAHLNAADEAKNAKLEAQRRVIELKQSIKKLERKEQQAEERVTKWLDTYDAIFSGVHGAEKTFERAFTALVDVLKALLPANLWEKIEAAYNIRFAQLGRTALDNEETAPELDQPVDYNDTPTP